MFWNVMDEMKNCCGYASSYNSCCKYGNFSLVATPLENAWKLSKQCALLCLTVLVTVRTSTGVSGPQMDPLGGNAPPLLWKTTP